MCRFHQLVCTVFVVVLIAPQYKCNPWFWWYPYGNRLPTQSVTPNQSASSAATSAQQQQSNLTIALGNRVNTDTGLDDYGTRVDGVTINAKRRRKRRDIWGLSSILGPNAPNGSYIAINNQVFPLPDNLSNVSLSIAALPSADSIPNLSQLTPSSFLPEIPENYTSAFHALVTRVQTLPLDVMDRIVRSLNTGYQNTFGRLFLEQSFARLNQTLSNGRTIVRNGLNNLVDQTGEGFAQIITRFKSSAGAVQQCVGDDLNPTNVARSVVDKGYSCINRKWQELNDLAGNIGEDIIVADKGTSELLANLTSCSGATVGTLPLSQSERNTLRRRCYVRVIASFPQSLLLLPVTLAIDFIKLYASVSGLEADVGACAAEVALAIGMATGQIGTRIVVCQVFAS